MVRNISPIVQSGDKWREGRGFSTAELKDADVSVGEARRLGIPVDIRRSTGYQENIDVLKIYIEDAQKAGVKYPKPKYVEKGQTGRTHRGLTAAGKKMRNLSHKK